MTWSPANDAASGDSVPGARIVSLQLHQTHGDRLRPVSEVRGRVDGGLIGDSHEGHRSRGVLVVDRSVHEALGLAPGDLREQITVEGLPGVPDLPADTELRLGGIALRVNGPCDPCTHIGALLGVSDAEAFRSALLGRRGALCTVVRVEGPARVGDRVELLTVARAV